MLLGPVLPGAGDGPRCWLAADGLRSRPVPRGPLAAARGARADEASASSAWVRSPGCGRETSLARIAADRVIFMAMAASPASVACRASTAWVVLARVGGQKIMGHQGAGSQENAADTAASRPGRSSATWPARASTAREVPPR